MPIQLNGLAPSEPSFQRAETSQKLNLSLASTISGQGASEAESKGFFGHIIAFFKWICCCCCCGSEPTPPIGNRIAQLIQKGKFKKAAKAAISTIEQDKKASKNPLAGLNQWLEKFCKANLFDLPGRTETNNPLVVAVEFAKEFLEIDDPSWVKAHVYDLLRFAKAIPAAALQSSNQKIQKLGLDKNISFWITWIVRSLKTSKA